MNAFVLSTGRCGSMTVARAFAHAENLTAGHESLHGSFYDLAQAYPADHVESDNRLAWMLGSLGRAYPDATWIHLLRRREEVVDSYSRRLAAGGWPGNLIYAVGEGLMQQGRRFTDVPRAAGRTWDIINDNITGFLRGREHRTVWLHQLTEVFPDLWEFVGARGDADAAVAETLIRHNAGRT